MDETSEAMLESDAMLTTDNEENLVSRHCCLGEPTDGDNGGVTNWKQQFMVLK
jgi:hypothetical protein